MSTKLFSTLLISAVSVSVYAKVDCKPFKQEAQHNEQIVADFSYELEKIEKKVQRLELKISDKLSAMDSAQLRIDSANSVIHQISLQQSGIIQSVQSVESDIQSKQIEANGLIQTINETQYQIDNLPPRSHARRQALRLNNRSKKILEKVQEDIVQLRQSIAPQRAHLAQLDQQIMEQQQVKQIAVQEKTQIANTKPTLSRLQQRKQVAESELINQDAIQQENLRLLGEAQEKVLMCQTYNVKYPTALKIVKRIYKAGCENYQLRNFENPYKADTEAEVLSQLCNY